MYYSYKTRFLFTFLIYITQVKDVYLWTVDDSGCPLSDNTYGNCVILSKCTKVLNLIKNAATFKEQTDIRLKYGCGLETVENGITELKVCCPYDNGNKDEQSKDIMRHKNFNLLPINNCGTIPNTDRIVFGNKAALNEFPWMALIKFNTTDYWKTSCSGTIISDRYILTAAHCLKNKNFVPEEIILGEHDVSKSKDCELNEDGEEECAPPIETYKIDKTIIHEDFNSNKIENDVALIRLSQRININKKNIRAICLPFNKKLAQIKSANGIVSGWGTTERELPSNILLRAELSRVSNKECKQLYKDTQISDNQICGMGATNKSSTCTGDSGGPYQFVHPINKRAKYVQHGIISFRTVYCSNDVPVVFTKIANYMNWILDNMRP